MIKANPLHPALPPTHSSKLQLLLFLWSLNAPWNWYSLRLFKAGKNRLNQTALHLYELFCNNSIYYAITKKYTQQHTRQNRCKKIEMDGPRTHVCKLSNVLIDFQHCLAGGSRPSRGRNGVISSSSSSNLLFVVVVSGVSQHGNIGKSWLFSTIGRFL